MVLLLGASGYIGQSFAKELRRRAWPFRPVSRQELDYSRFDVLLDHLRQTKPAFLINAAGYVGRPNVDACETARADALRGNTLLPAVIAHACAATGTPWGQVSTGCIYTGAYLVEGGQRRFEKDLNRPEVRNRIETNPAAVAGFSEADEPNFTFDRPPCSFYSGTKALAEQTVLGVGQSYLWRMRIPFDEFDQSKNYLTKLQRYDRLYDAVNSLSHRGDFVKACLDLWERRAPFGLYNLTNPGFVTTRQVAGLIQQILAPSRDFKFFASDEEFYGAAAKAPRSNCVLDVSKALRAGVKLRPVEDAIVEALKGWQPEHAPREG